MKIQLVLLAPVLGALLIGCAAPAAAPRATVSDGPAAPSDGPSPTGNPDGPSDPAPAGSLAASPKTTGPGDSLAGSPPTSAPPTGALPAPADAAAQIQQIVDKYGLTSLTGDAATTDNLTRFDAAWDRLPREFTRGLRIVMQKTEPGETVGPDGSGVWMPVDAAGKVIEPPVKDASLVAGGQITYIGAAPVAWCYVHEVGHHVTLFLDPDFGRKLVDALGYTVRGSATLLATPDQQVRKTRVKDADYPTDYSKDNHTEHLAELFTEHLARDLATGPVKLRKQFRLSPAVREILKAKLGEQKDGQA